MADFLASLSRSGEPPKPVVVAGVAIGLHSSIEELLDEVERYVEEGYLRVKLKIAPGWDDIPVGEVRRRWPELVLFADANGAYAEMGPAEVAERLGRLDGHELACIEQPLGDDDLAGHRELARQVRTPLCLDEALTSVASVSSALDMGACSVVNVKAGRLGGYLEAVRVHDLCADRGVPVWCGGMVETGVGRAANVALASLPNFILPGDLSASGRFFEQDLAGPLVLGPGGTILVPGGPGSGVTINPGALGAFATWRRWYPAG
jgi:O-succinylbenzoate synthase